MARHAAQTVIVKRADAYTQNRAQDCTRFCIFAAMSSVKSAVLPPAPHVMSQKVGPYAAMRSCLSNRFATPCVTDVPR